MEDGRRKHEGRLYEYVGPKAIRALAADGPGGALIRSCADLLPWVEGKRAALTFIVDARGELRVADRHSEHVACAGGAPVRAAGELFVEHDGAALRVVEVSNQSTGYCPESACWADVARALDAIGLAPPGGFTLVCEFRRCPSCGERNLVKDGWLVCGTCGGELPVEWNFA
jgi:hypothetical protein